MKLLFLLAAPALLAQSSYPGAADLDRAITEAIEAGDIPGAVVRIGQPGKVLFQKAYGSRALVPAPEPMTEDTIFDAASLTKPVVTGSALMRLFEQGRIRLNDPVTRYLPEFQGGKSDITIRQLSTHFSGLRPDLDLVPAWTGYSTGIAKALIDQPVAAPGERFIYSDINFELLGEIVRRLSGKNLNDYFASEIAGPLAMRDSMFLPPASLRPRIAPTEMNGAAPFRGIVHDETARFMGGVAGHAGLFTTAADLGRFLEMLLNGGQLGSLRLFQSATIRKFTEPASPADKTELRGLGWDIDSRFSANRGELFPLGSFGHTGFTGTSVWADPGSKTYAILLTNAVHPHRKPPINSLRSRVATIAALHAGVDLPGSLLTTYTETLVGARRLTARAGSVLSGLDVLSSEGFRALAGRRVGLITNHTGITRDGARGIDRMAAAGVQLVKIFSPEHGITGTEDHENVGHSKDAATGIPIHSLYLGENRKPSATVLSGIDVLIFDIQDVGVRFYTYMCTLMNVMEAAGKAGVPLMVLDRPNPINGVQVEGPQLEKEAESFVGCYPMPLRHGMTIGEIALMANQERAYGAKLEVVKMKGWLRSDWFDSTGLTWLDPSPNMRGMNAATLYAGIGMLEFSKDYSVGRGTDVPFEHIGAPWIKGPELARYLNSRSIPGVRVYPTRFKPNASKLEGKTVEGVRFVVTDRNVFSSANFGVELAGALRKLYPKSVTLADNLKLIGNRNVLKMLQDGLDPRTINASIDDELAPFLTRRRKFLLY